MDTKSTVPDLQKKPAASTYLVAGIGTCHKQNSR